MYICITYKHYNKSPIAIPLPDNSEGCIDDSFNALPSSILRCFLAIYVGSANYNVIMCRQGNGHITVFQTNLLNTYARIEPAKFCQTE